MLKEAETFLGTKARVGEAFLPLDQYLLYTLHRNVRTQSKIHHTFQVGHKMKNTVKLLNNYNNCYVPFKQMSWRPGKKRKLSIWQSGLFLLVLETHLAELEIRVCIGTYLSMIIILKYISNPTHEYWRRNTLRGVCNRLEFSCIDPFVIASMFAQAFNCLINW